MTPAKKIKKVSKEKKIEKNLHSQPTLEPILQHAPIETENPQKKEETMPTSIPESGLESTLIREKHNYYLKIILVGMALAMIALVLVFMLRDMSKKFEYVGLQFEKIKFDKLPLFHAKIPISSTTGQVIANFNLYLRNDPRTLENIPITGRISLKRTAVIALDKSMEGCSDNSIAGVNLGQFLAAAGVKAIPGTTNQSEADENIVYTSCDNPNTVIVTEKADKTQIIQAGESCYKIQVSSCEDMVRATERFMMLAVGQSSGYNI